MDEWLFISLAKTKADAPNVKSKVKSSGAPKEPVLGKLDTATALDYRALAERDGFRGAVAVAAAVLINAAFLVTIEQRALDARTPAGEVIVAELDPQSLPVYAQAAIDSSAPAVAL